MNRIDRLTAMIIFLQGHHRVTVKTISERYDISSRTVYRDLNALQEAGVPIGFEKGEGYFIVEGYHLPPVMFDKEEAVALLAGERMMQKWNNTALSRSYISALDKIRAVLHPAEKQYLETLDQHIQTITYPDESKKHVAPNVFSFLQHAIFNTHIISITYYSPYKEETTTREVEPLGLLFTGNSWYLAAWCLLRNDYRMFRLHRIKHYFDTGIPVPDSTHHTLKEFYERSLHKESDLHTAIIRFDKKMIRYMGDQKYYHGWISQREHNGEVEMTFLSPSLEYLSRWLLIWGGTFTVVEPEWVKNRVQELIEELYFHHTKVKKRTDNLNG